MHFGGYENPPPALHIATRSCMMILVSWLVNETNACIYARNDKGQDLVEIADGCNNQLLCQLFHPVYGPRRRNLDEGVPR